ncbi:MAG: hypothetical protein JRI76_05455 [Deltaproteobacteria bacterium]|nr:hypothetical protein [Deltaproteobacteria bacterium]MBW1954436.1 hypothetical protein [Deltaproteobacteria bacterium]MBW2041464.1 hypothetical protein [Deltaproteobacteria bacterium]MBW2131645.1 hypothetical protein [Deltaproteobacteria bacterium]
MDLVYSQIRRHAKEIISRHSQPEFYRRCPQANRLSKKIFETDPVVLQLLDYITPHLENDFGHGMEHAEKVSLDAGALMIIEGDKSGHPEPKIRRNTRLVQCAGLLHDVKRKERDHAEKGALYAQKTLKHFPFSRGEITKICMAIRSHEAFKKRPRIEDPEALLVADCLYDGDKFRWGPDNFLNTIWDMVSFYQTPLPRFIDYFPKGMEGLVKIRDTFRTPTGKKYGPQFIDIGISIGNELYRVICSEYGRFCFQDSSR